MTSTVITTAAERRSEVFAAIGAANTRQEAIDAVARLLSVPVDQAEQVLDAPLGDFVTGNTGASTAEEPHGFTLQPFRDTEEHTALYASRAADPTSAPAGQWDDAKVEAERSAGLERMELEHAMWFVAVDTARDAQVGLVFGEQEDEGRDVTVAVWIAPEERKKGYGLNALKESRRALAAYFPGAQLVVRSPLPGK